MECPVMASPQELEADFFGLSTLGPVRDYGQGLNRRLEAQQKRRDRPMQNLGKGIMLGPDGNVIEIPEYAQAIAGEREHQQSLINQRLTTSKESRDAEFQRKKDLIDYKIEVESGTVPKLGSSEKKEIASNQALINQADEAIEMMRQNPGAVSQFGGLIPNMMRDADLLGGANIVESFTKSPEELKTLSMMRKSGADIKRALSGAAFTMMEKALGTAFQFDAPGITADEAIRRFETFLNYYKENQEMLLKVTQQDPNLMGGEMAPEVEPEQAYQDERAKRKAALQRRLETN